MQLPSILERQITPANPFSLGPDWVDSAMCGAALLIAVSFAAYLMCCYLQEFRRERRVRRRKELSRATSRSHPFEPIFFSGAEKRFEIHEPPHRPAPTTLGKLDCWRLQWVIPTHEQITLVWDTRSPEEAPSVELYVPRRDSDKAKPPATVQMLVP